jgi:hypothetical protein
VTDLPTFDPLDVPLVDFENHAIGVERRDFEQDGPLLDRGTELLREIARDQHSVEGGPQNRPLAPVFDAGQLGTGFLERCRDYLEARSVTLRERLAVLVH